MKTYYLILTILYLTLSSGLFGQKQSSIATEVEVRTIASNLWKIQFEEGKRESSRMEKLIVATKNPKTKRFVALVNAFVLLKVGKIEESKASLSAIRGKLENWETYYLYLAEAQIAAKSNRTEEVINKIDWLIDHHAEVVSEQNNAMSRALLRGLEGENGDLLAGILHSKAGILSQSGRRNEALQIYQQIQTQFPNSGWARKARKRAIHLENAQSLSELDKF